MDVISADQLGLATLIGEAIGEPYEGKLGVAEVIRRRTRTRYGSKGTVASTVLMPQQFSMWNTSEDGRVRACLAQEESPPVQECKRAWEESATSNTVPGAVLYHADYVRPKWAEKVRFIKQIGHHLFYADPVLDKHPALDLQGVD